MMLHKLYWTAVFRRVQNWVRDKQLIIKPYINSSVYFYKFL